MKEYRTSHTFLILLYKRLDRGTSAQHIMKTTLIHQIVSDISQGHSISPGVVVGVGVGPSIDYREIGHKTPMESKLTPHGLQLLQNRHLSVHPPINAVLGTCLLAFAEATGGNVAGDALLPACVVEAVDSCKRTVSIYIYSKSTFCGFLLPLYEDSLTLLESCLLGFTGQDCVELLLVRVVELGKIELGLRVHDVRMIGQVLLDG